MNEIAELESKLRNLEAAQRAAGGNLWDKNSAMIAGGMFLVFVLIIFGLITYLIRNGTSGAVVLRTFTIPLVIVMGVFLIIIGYSSQQISPVIGLLGTIAGYLLANGKEPKKAVKESSQVDEEV